MTTKQNIEIKFSENRYSKKEILEAMDKYPNMQYEVGVDNDWFYTAEPLSRERVEKMEEFPKIAGITGSLFGTLIMRITPKPLSEREQLIKDLEEQDANIVGECELMAGNGNHMEHPTYNHLDGNWNMFTTETLKIFLENIEAYKA